MNTAWKGAVEGIDVEIGLEAVELASVAVAANGEVDQVEPALVRSAVEDVGGAQDHPGARAEHRQPVDQSPLEFVEQPAGGEQPRHRGALTAGQHDRVEPLEIGRRTHHRRGGTELHQSLAMGVEGALQREDADGQAGPGSAGVTSPDRHIAG